MLANIEVKIYELEFNNLNSHQNGRGEAEEMAVSCARAQGGARQRWTVCQSSGITAKCLVSTLVSRVFPHLDLLAVPGLLPQQGDGLLPGEAVLLQALLLWQFKIYFFALQIFLISHATRLPAGLLSLPLSDGHFGAASQEPDVHR